MGRLVCNCGFSQDLRNVDKNCPRFFCVLLKTRVPMSRRRENIADIMAELIHIGHIIQEELRAQGRTVTWLAQQLNIHRRACYRIFDNYSIDTQLLFRISQLLGRNFFEEYSNKLLEESLL